MTDQATNSSGKGGKLAQLSIFESKADDEAKKATNAQATGAGPGRSFVAAEGDRCEVCAKRVYIAEKLEADGRVMHKSCFRCAHCNGALKLGTYASLQGKYYCKPHFKQLFALKGNYAEGFGEKKPQDVWMRGKEGGDEPDAATTDGADAERQRREDAERERQRIEAQEKDRLMRAAREREREQLQNQQKSDEEAARQKRQEWEKRERERLEREEKEQQERRKRESEAREREASAAAARQQQQKQQQQQQQQAKDQGQDAAKRNADKERELQRREREIASKERELKDKERDLDRKQAQQQQQQHKPQHGGGGTSKKELELERKVQELQETLAAKDRQLQKLQAGKPAPAATTGPSAALPRARGQWGWYAFAAAPYVVCTLWLAFLWH